MPQNPTPAPDPKIATEAKLCAYLEGTLPADERGEIEAYLQSNPQHRALLQELRNTRALLKDLPQESAPPEIAEAFEQQLERSMLLDDLAVESPTRRAGAPQRLLVAGLVLLACGLGVAVYLALPGSGSPTQHLVSAVPGFAPGEHLAATQASSPSLESAPTSAPVVTLPMVASTAPSPAAPLRTATTMPVVPSTLPANDTASAFELARQALNRTSLSPTRTTLLLLRSSDPAAGLAVTNYFRTGVIPFQTLDLLATPATSPSGLPITSTTQPISGSAPPSSMPSESTAAPSSPVTPPTGFVARNLSSREVARLETQLSAGYGAAAVNVYAPAAWSTRATTQPAADAVLPDELLTVTVDQLVGPGVEKTNTIRVNADGTIALPMLLEPIPAAGSSLDALQNRVADRYRGAHLISQPTVRIVPATDDPASAGANSPVSTEPAALPATAATTAADSTVDLLVLVLPPGTPERSPATQPAVP